MTYDMNIRPDNMPGVEDDARQAAIERYENSTTLIVRALDTVGGIDFLHPDNKTIVDAIRTWYVGTSMFVTDVDDLLDGELDL